LNVNEQVIDFPCPHYLGGWLEGLFYSHCTGGLWLERAEHLFNLQQQSDSMLRQTPLLSIFPPQTFIWTIVTSRSIWVNKGKTACDNVLIRCKYSLHNKEVEHFLKKTSTASARCNSIQS